MFQSHCGAIKRSHGHVLPSRTHQGFNPTVVRLKGAAPCREARLCPSFNPTVVRLKDTRTIRPARRGRWFQSHCGAIKSVVGKPCRAVLDSFQSHCGAIKRSTAASHLEKVPWSFNPTVVRLKGPQFVLREARRPRFNPTVVRLKADESGVRAPDRVLVSIPLWCD